MALTNEPISPSPAEAKLAKESSRKLSTLVAKEKPELKVQVHSARGKAVEETIALPRGAMELLVQLLTEMGKGNAVTVMPIHAQLTTQEAADILGVSRPFVIKQIREGKLKFQQVGTHRRIKYEDLMEFRRKSHETHNKAMDELVKEAQELGMGY
jgi:excisionase family DNA binding protein